MNILVKNLSYKYSKNNYVLNDVSFNIAEGNIAIILGPNGVGKSTLLKCIDDILKYKEGTIYIDNKDLHQLKANERARTIAFVKQYPDFGDVSVFDAILFGRTPYIYGEVSKEDKELVVEIIHKLHLEKIALANVNEISGGERQIVAIARALAQKPKIILFDEPTSNLDIKNQENIIQLIKYLSINEKVTILVTMHDINTAMNLGNYFILIKGGKIFKEGDEGILNKDNIKSVYDVNVNLVEINKKKHIVLEEKENEKND